MKKLLLGLSVAAALVLSACGGSRGDPQALDDALAGFAACVQSSRWQEALEYVDKDEGYAIAPDGYEFKEEYKVAARRLSLSTLRKEQGLSLSHGRLVGIKKAMDEANERYVMSENQAKVGTNLKEMEDARIKRRLAEGQKVMQEEAESANQEQEVKSLVTSLLMKKSASMEAPVTCLHQKPTKTRTPKKPKKKFTVLIPNINSFLLNSALKFVFYEKIPDLFGDFL